MNSETERRKSQRQVIKSELEEVGRNVSIDEHSRTETIRRTKATKLLKLK